MKQETLDYISKNRPMFEFWIKRNERLQSSQDLLTPIIPEFTEANPSVNVNGCPDCIIDMLRWAIKELKASLGEETAEEKVSKAKTKKDAKTE